MVIFDLLFFLNIVVACCFLGYLSYLSMTDREKFNRFVEKWSKRNPLLSSKQISSDQYKSFSKTIVLFLFLTFIIAIIFMIKDFLNYGQILTY